MNCQREACGGSIARMDGELVCLLCGRPACDTPFMDAHRAYMEGVKTRLDAIRASHHVSKYSR